MCIILFKGWDGPKTCVVIISIQSHPVTAGQWEGAGWKAGGGDESESRWSDPIASGFTTPGVFRTFARATRTFKACEPPPCRHLHDLGLSLNLPTKQRR